MHFARHDAALWLAWVGYARASHFDDVWLLAILEDFAVAIAGQRSAMLSKGTESRISRLCHGCVGGKDVYNVG